MVLIAAIAFILLVLAAAAFTVGSDLWRRPPAVRLAGLKEWQALVGSVLGFMGASGVLVLGTAIASEQDRQAVAKREHSIGLALAYEAERLGNELGGDIGIVYLIRAHPNQDYARTCHHFITTLKDTLDKEKPVWAAALGQMAEFGDENLQLFVRFHGLYDDIIHDLRVFNESFCETDGKNQIEQYARRIEFAFDYYHDISLIYDTAYVEPPPVALVETEPEAESPAIVEPEVPPVVPKTPAPEPAPAPADNTPTPPAPVGG